MKVFRYSLTFCLSAISYELSAQLPLASSEVLFKLASLILLDFFCAEA